MAMIMPEFFINNLEFFITAACGAAVCIWLARRGQLAKIRQIILSLCVDAELTYGGGTGEIKKSSVIEAVYRLLPSWAKLLFSGRALSKLVEEGKSEMDTLAEGNTKVMALLYDIAAKEKTNSNAT